MSAPVQKQELDQLCINTIRALTLDAVQKAESGHPGLPLGAAPMVDLGEASNRVADEEDP